MPRQNLKVTQAREDDIYRDIVRVAEENRLDGAGRPIPEGSVCRIMAGDRAVYGLVRGVRGVSAVTLGAPEACIYIDERLRNALGLKVGDVVPVGLRIDRLGELRWAWTSSDPAYRAMARLAVLSVALAILGVILGVAGLWVAFAPR